jgi:uncharacterized protein (TIGR03118 family)
MLFSALLRNGKRSAPAPRPRTQTSPRQRASFRPRLEALENRLTPSAAFVQTNLVSDIPGLAQVTNANSVNAWGLAASSRGPFWVVNQGTGTSTVYDISQPNNASPPQVMVDSLVVNIPPAQGTPTGEVFNIGGTGTFNLVPNDNSTSSVFLFATTNGTISGWNPSVDPTNAVIGATNPGAVYFGLAIGTDSHGDTLLYAADFANNTIDVYDQNFQRVTTLAGNFTDSDLPGDYRVFNVQAINNQLYVEYAPFDPSTVVAAGPAHGAVDIYNTDGQLQQRLIRHGHLNDPWAVALAPANFGSFSNDLLVGNFGDGHINAFDPKNGHFAGEMKDPNGQPITIQHLWALGFGNDGRAGPANTLFFTAGLTSHLGAGTGTPHGLFGSLQTAPAPAPAREAMTVNGSVPVPASNNLVGMSSSLPNFSSEQDQGIEALSVMSNTMTMVPASDLQAMHQRIDALFRTSNAMRASRESRLEMMDPQPSTFISMFNADLDALETMIVLM